MTDAHMGPCTGKVALVVGGASGIGLAITKALLSGGATIYATSRDQRKAEQAIEAMGAAAGNAHALELDVSDTSASAAVVEGVASDNRRLDAVILNAGINPYFERAENVTPDMWDEIFSTNIRGLFFAAQASAKQMLEAGGGSIVFISSVTARVGTLRGVPYVATKGGIDSLTRTLAVEWADRGIRVNSIAPGYIDTALTEGLSRNDSLHEMLMARIPMKRFGTPDEVGELAVLLVSDKSSYVTGQIFTVNGGMGAG